MHAIFKNDYWEQQCIRDDSDYLARNLLQLSKKYSIPLRELQELFPDVFNVSELKGCGIILYTNTIKRDSFRVRVMLDEKKHDSRITVDVLVSEIIRNGGEVKRKPIVDVEEEFTGKDCKSAAAEFCREWVERIEMEYLKD